MKHILCAFALMALVMSAPALALESSVEAVEVPGPTPQPPAPCDANLGEACSAQSDCTSCITPYQSFCVWCPDGTTMEIGTDTDPYYARLTDDTNTVTRDGGAQGYCAYPSYLACAGEWNGNEYTLSPGELRQPDPEQYMPLTRMFGRDVLDLWKSLALETVSEDYFNSHFRLEHVNFERVRGGSGPGVENDLLRVRLTYNFTHDWAEAARGDNWELFTIAEKRNGVWTRLTEEEMRSYYDKELERWHSLEWLHPGDPEWQKIKLTEEEMGPIISEQEAITKLRGCNSAIGMDELTVSSAGNSTLLIVQGKANLNTEGCLLGPQGTYTVVAAGVNLETGEVTCESRESACAVYSPGAGAPGSGGSGGDGNSLLIYGGIALLIVVVIVVLVAVVLTRRKKAPLAPPAP